MFKTIRRATLCLAALAAAAPAAAQTAGAERIDEVRRDSRVHVGPFYLTPTVRVKEFGVDSNVFNAAGEQESDFTFTLNPRADVWVPVARRALFQGTAGADLVWYAQHDSERSVDPQFTGRGEVYLRRVTFFAENAFLNTRQRLNYEVDLRARHLRNAAAAGVAVRITPKLSVEVAGRRSDTRFDADAHFDGTNLQRTLNQATTGLAVTARHHLTPLTTLALRTERMRDAFEFSPERDSSSVRVMPGVEFNPRALVKGTAYVGYRRFTPSASQVLPDFSGLVADLGLSYTLLGATTFGVTYKRDLSYSYTELRPFFVSNSAGVSVRRALGRRLDALVSLDRHRYDFRNLLVQPAATDPETGLPVAPAPLGPRQDTTWNYGASVGYRFGEGRIGFGVSYLQRDSPAEAFRAYDNLRFGTTVTYGF